MNTKNTKLKTKLKLNTKSQYEKYKIRKTTRRINTKSNTKYQYEN